MASQTTRNAFYLWLILASGLAMIAAALIWWLIVFTKVLATGTLGLGQSLVCFGTSSVLCDLAMSLCSTTHFLGIKFYSPYLLWIGAAVLSTATLRTLRKN